VKLVCQFCDAVMQNGPDDRVSHGICEDCAQELVVEDDDEFLAAWSRLTDQARLRKEAVCP
jgi:hypothetical protein